MGHKRIVYTLRGMLPAASVLSSAPALEGEQSVDARLNRLEQLVEFAIPAGEGFKVGKTRVTCGGYVKLGAISQRTSGGQLGGNSILRNFLFPSSIPVGGRTSVFDADFSARQFRFLFKTETGVGTDHKRSGLIEREFDGTAPGGGCFT